MTNENQYIMSLLSAHVLNKPVTLPEHQVDWSKLLETAKAQSIQPMLYDKIAELPPASQPHKTVMKSLENAVMVYTYLYANHAVRMSGLLEEMSAQKISVVCLKGMVLRDWYPVPEFRTMGDFDIYTAKESMEKVIAFFQNHGYEIIDKKRSKITCRKANMLEWEIACTMESEFKMTYHTLDSRYLSEVKNWNHGQYMPSDTLFFQHIAVHTAKHLLQNGAGVRNLSDLALCMMKTDDIDYMSVRKSCEEEGYLKAYAMLLNCVHKWFGIDISKTGVEIVSDDAVDEVTEYMLSEGIYGKTADGNILMDVAMHNDQSPPWRKIFFPSIKLMRRNYGYLRKYPWLLPVAWIQRVFFNVVVKRRIAVRNLVGNIEDSVNYAKEHEEMLKKIGLK